MDARVAASEIPCRPQAPRWMAQGCPSPAPHVVKIDVVKSFVTRSEYGLFIETGTYLGSTVEVIARLGVRCHSIELDPDLFSRARHILRRHKNIDFVLGDSAVRIPELLEQVHEPSVFWLDGHFSGGVTARGAVDTPVAIELEAILMHKVKEHIILIDDAREFTGVGDYPLLSEVLQALSRDDQLARCQPTALATGCHHVRTGLNRPLVSGRGSAARSRPRSGR